MHVCNRCGKENQDHYKFCLGCGAEIGDAPVRPAAAAPAAMPVTAFDTRGLDDDWGAAPAPPAAPRPASPVRAAADEEYAATSAMPAAPPHRDTDPGRAEPPRANPVRQPQSIAAPAPVVAPAPSADGSGRACTNCGNVVPSGFLFCGQCGARIEAAQAPRPVAPVAQAAAAPAPKGKLILIRPDGTEGGSHALAPSINKIGRGNGPLFDADSYLSPHHADLLLGPGGLQVRDTGSLNGVFVKITEEEEISDGEVFRIGQELLRFDVIRPPATLEDGTEVMGSPNPGYWGRVALIIGREQDGSAFPLIGDNMVLGRERGEILFPEDGYVSGTHARISVRGGRFYLADLNSSNGTFLRIRGERPIRSGTFLLMGQQLFRAQYA